MSPDAHCYSQSPGSHSQDTSSFHNRRHTCFQIIDVILIQDDDRDHRIALHLHDRPVNSENIRIFNRCRNVQTLVMLLKRPSSRIHSILFALGISGSRIRMRPPVIQSLRNMADSVRLLDTPQDKVIILCPVEPAVKSPDLSAIVLLTTKI